ncbi:alpha-L-fucosidase [Nonomuraea sp. NPDC050328]|uniref:alpha-L-fucosidase n=1 Tax=Nonomuraea sp. NPDC050328 TaxID=3364361 RepID=UPI00379C5BD3
MLRLKRILALSTLLVIGCIPAQAEAQTIPDPYEPTVESLNSHPTPKWFNDDKFGIFLHWGAYSVPAWGPRGSYAEWYWYYMNSPGNATNAYHRATYGEDADYDRFAQQWKAEKFDPADWVKLFNDAGAKYFVLTSKHHEGVALWDSKVSERDTVAMGPKRDLAKELFTAARKDGKLRAGFYYSLMEWYNPQFTGQPARNPYTGQPVPYTGGQQGGDYVKDYMLPQMRELIDGYDPDILWCDGQWDRSAAQWQTAGVIADYYNKAAKAGKEVAVANRCKIESGALESPELDFQTPEYSVKPDIDPVKWESSRGIAHSYGFNQNEPVEDYLTSDQLVDSFVDIVSKNGNLLLNVGPKADGTIPELQRQRLLDMGAWLKVNGEAMYGTTYWTRAEEKGGPDDLRYTVKDGALYATALKWPGEQLTLGADVPVGPGTRITLLGSDGGALPWTRDGQGRVVVTTPAETGQWAYSFKIETPGVAALPRFADDVPQHVQAGQSVTGKVTVTNTGSRPMRAATLSVAAPEGWTVTPATSRLGHVEPGASVEVPVSVSVPEGAQPADLSLQATLKTGRLRVPYSIPVSVVLPDLAQGKPATQQSTGYDAPASRAVDGNTDGAFWAGSVSHTAEPARQAWWQVDLGAAASLDSVEIWNRTDCCADRLRDYWVIASEQPITADGLEEARSAPGVTAVHVREQAGRPSTVKLPAGTTGRYVRIQLASETHPLTLAEVRVRGR